ncbi:beta-galactosidase [Aestuariimicrobium soli]|uniref:beta-galactosidase n=1 Tax=Aestuariimicrobium soli TaxID=2035834 RepID=UPI003EC0745F
MTSVEVSGRQLLIDGHPRVVVAGEIHYFRVPRDEWEQRLDLLVEAGCNTVASYIPWLVHELADGSIDVAGDSDPQLDLGAFIDLCAERGLWFIARPGPFQMAELKNEGLPYRVYREHPEIVPVGWDGEPCPSATVDYLAPAFLTETRRWYEAVMPVLVERLATAGGPGAGGPVIAVQLDNEIGMLAWVTNSPDLTDHLLDDLRSWVKAKHGDRVGELYPATSDADAWARAVRSPDEAWAGQLRVDLTEFMRGRFARYVDALRSMAEQLGVRGVPFLINIHGTSGGSGEPFPIGISQLVETYGRRPGYLSGSDHYVGDLTLNTTPDLYVINAFQAAVHDADQPITSLEFEAGTGDYGGGIDQQYDPHTVELKTRLFLAQGNRMINYYLLAGGFNPPLHAPVDDGNDRIAFTGARHGFAAPITPEGERGPTFAPTARAAATARVLEPWLATSSEELDDLSLAFVLDSYATEYAHPSSAVMQRVTDDLRRWRGAGPRRALARPAMMRGQRFDAVDVQHDRAREVDGRPVTVMCAVSQHLSEATQRWLVDHCERGGSLLLVGRVPEFDLAGRECRVLADALGVVPGEPVSDGPHTYPSVVSHGWAAPEAEVRVGWAQPLQVIRGEVLLTLAGSGPERCCGLDVELGRGRVVLFTAELPGLPSWFGRALDRLGVSRGLRLSSEFPGLFGTTTVSEPGESRLLHLWNISGYEMTGEALVDGEPVVGEGLRLMPYTGWMLPLGLELSPVSAPGVRLWANAELVGHTSGPDGLTLEFGAPLTSATHPGLWVRVEGAPVTVDEDRCRAVIAG